MSKTIKKIDVEVPLMSKIKIRKIGPYWYVWGGLFPAYFKYWQDAIQFVNNVISVYADCYHRRGGKLAGRKAERH